MGNGFLTLRETTEFALNESGEAVLRDPRMFKSIVLDCMSNDDLDTRVLKRCCEEELLLPFASYIKGSLTLQAAKTRARIWMVDECLMHEEVAKSVVDGIAEGVDGYLRQRDGLDMPPNVDADGEDTTIQIVHKAPDPPNARIRIEKSLEEVRERDILFLLLFVKNACNHTIRLRLNITFYDDAGNVLGVGEREDVVSPNETTLLSDDSYACDAVGATWTSYTLRAEESEVSPLDNMLYFEIERSDKNGVCLYVRNDGYENAFIESVQLYGENGDSWLYDPIDVQDTLTPGENLFIDSGIDFTDCSWSVYPIGWSLPDAFTL